MTTRNGRHAAPEAPSDAPERSSVDPGSISTLRAGQGAKVATRKNASEAADRARRSVEERYYERHPEARSSMRGPSRSGRNVVLLVVAAVLVLAVVFLLARCVASLGASDVEEEGESTTSEQTLRLSEEEQAALDEQNEHDSGYEQADVDGSVSYGTNTYTLQALDDGTWGLVCTTSSGTTETLFTIEGTPVALLRTVDALLVPENRDGGWDVLSYVIDGHDQVSYVADSSGEAIQGSGDIESVELDGTTLTVTDSTGETTEISLE